MGMTTTIRPPLAAVLVSVLASGCVDDSVRRAADASGDTGPAGPPCDGNEDCARFANACNDAVCVDGACRSEPVVCDDHSACTVDHCDQSRGCVFEAREAGTPCLADRSEECVGQAWHRADRCDAAGSCADGGVENCAVGSAPAQCQTYACVAAVGCALVPLSDGSACVQGGRSDTCVDGVRYAADECVDGTCVEGGSEPCPTDFCFLPACDGKQCGNKAIGVDVDITGLWTVFQLVAGDPGPLVATRMDIELTAGGEVVVQSMLASRDLPRPDRGSYCVATDNTLQLVFTYDDQPERDFSGRVGRARDLAVLAGGGRDAVTVLVKRQTVAEAKKISGSYRIVGLDRVVGADATQIDSVLGSLAFDRNWCVGDGAYSLGSTDVPVTIETSQLRCIDFADAGAIALEVDAAGDPHRWNGAVGPDGHFAVLQRVADDDVPVPSLIVLVREGLGGAGTYVGDYVTTRLTASASALELTPGAQTVDGQRHVLALTEPGWSLGPGDEGSFDVSDVAPFSAVIETITIGGTTRKRVGQLGPDTNSKSDWFVDLACATTSSSVLGPPRGASLRFGIRVP